jgi:dolichyl-phosphate beta-glucosyltransferase
MPAAPPRLSVVLPCYDERERLPATLRRLCDYLSARGDPFEDTFEILVVDDGSTDDTAALAEAAARAEPRVRVLRLGANRGKGYAVAQGMRHARGEWILFSDADLSTPIEELERFVPLLAQGFEVVIGSRALAGARLRVRQPWWRERAGRFMNVCIRRLSGLPFRDTQCGFKLFTRAAAADVFPNLTVSGWMFDVEALVLAQRLGYRIAEQPVTWINSARSHVKVRHAPRIFRDLLHVRWHWLGRQPTRAGAAVPMPGDGAR